MIIPENLKLDRGIHIGVPRVDLNLFYGTPQARLAAAQSAIRNTQFGRGGVIRVSLDSSGNVEFILNTTGEKFSSINNAVARAGALGVNQIETFSIAPQPLSRVGRIVRSYNKFGSAKGIFELMGKRAASLTDEQKQFLRDSGIDIDRIGEIQPSVSFIKSGSSGGGSRSLNVGTVIQRARDEGRLAGVFIPDDESARVIGLALDGASLSSYQTHLLFSVLGQDVYNQNKIIRSIHSAAQAIQAPGGVDFSALEEASIGLNTPFEKGPKRLRGPFSERDISMAGQDLVNLVKRFAGQSGQTNVDKFSDVILFNDPAFEILKRWALKKTDLRKFAGADEDALAEFYNIFNPRTFMTDLLDSLDTKLGSVKVSGQKTKNTTLLKKAIRNFVEQEYKNPSGPDGKFMYERLQDYLMSNFATVNGQIDQDREIVIKSIFQNIKQSFDGADPMNKRFLDTVSSNMGARMGELEHVIRTTTDQAERAEARLALANLQALRDRVRSGDIEAIIGRGRSFVPQLNEAREIKNSWYAADFFRGKELKRFAAIITPYSLKSEATIGGIAGDTAEYLIMDGIGIPRPTVYADAVTMAFHPEYFADEKTLESIEKNFQRVGAELQETLETGVIPRKLMKAIEMGANQDVEQLPLSMRSAAVRNREFMKQILELHRSGVSPKDSPRMIKLLASVFATEAFTMDEGKVLPAVPDMFRFNLRSESTVTASGGKRQLVGSKSVHNVRFLNATQDVEVPVFRIKGHTVFFPSHAVAVYGESLGGFDLDDKGLPRLVTYKDNKGATRLASFMVRQPSGVEEIIFHKLQMDQSTIKALLGHQDYEKVIDKAIAEATSYGFDVHDVNKLQLIRSTLRGKMPKVKDSDIRSLDQEGFEKMLIRLKQIAVDEFGHSEFVELSDEAMEKIVTRGPSSLSRADLFQRVARRDSTGSFILDSQGKRIYDVKPLAPEYSAQGINKLLLDEGVFDLSRPIRDALDNEAGIDAGLKARLSAASSYDEMLVILDDWAQDTVSNPLGKQQVASLISVARERASISSLANPNNIIGLYVNRSMLVGQQINQHAAFLEELIQAHGVEGQAIVDFMNKSLGIGLLPQETALDIGTTAAEGRRLASITTNLIETQASYIDPDKLGPAMGKLLQVGRTGEITNLNEVGEFLVESFGKRIGFARAFGVSGSDTFLGIDKMLLERLGESDARRILSGVVMGADIARSALQSGQIAMPTGINAGAADLSQEYIDEIESIRQMLQPGESNREQILTFIKEKFGLSADHKFAAQARVQAVAESGKSLIDAITNAHIAKIGSDPILDAVEVSDVDRRMAEMLIQRHKEALSRLSQSRAIDSAEAYVADVLYRERVGASILSDIGTAAKVSGVSMKGLVDALDQYLLPQGFDIGTLSFAVGDADTEAVGGVAEISRNITLAKRLRRIDYYAGMDQTIAQEVLGEIKSKPIKPGKIRKTLQKLDLRVTPIVKRLEKTASSIGLTDEEEAVLDTLRVITGNRDVIQSTPSPTVVASVSEAETDMLRRQADLNANIVRSLLEEEAMIAEEGSARIDSLRAVGNISAPSQAAGVTDDFISVLTPTPQSARASRSIYKRFTKADLNSLLKNPTAKKIGLAATALIAGSFAYSAYKDRTFDDMKGPPLLPGGSAYEQQVNQQAINSAQLNFSNTNQGTTYNINIQGDRNSIAKFNQMAAGLANNNINTTIYNRIPELGNDPYRSVASSY